MKLPIPSLNKKNLNPEYYLALLLLDDKARAVILQEASGNLQIIDSQEEEFKDSLEDADIEEWITSVDTAIGRAEDKLPPDIETHKTVFGVKQTWTDETKIKSEYLEKLKKLGQALDLKPIGFIVISEAITKLIEQEDGSPLSAILVEQSRNSATVTLLRAGKIQETQKIDQKESLALTVDEALKRFAQPTLPARIILSVLDTDERVSQEVIAHHWSKSLPFLHVPQITVLPEGFDARAVVAGAAAQMGFTVPEGFLDKLSPDITPAKDDSNNLQSVSKEAIAPDTQEISDEKFGFSENAEQNQTETKDETPEDKEEKPPEDQPKKTSLQHEAPAFGFSEGEEAAKLEKSDFGQTPPVANYEENMDKKQDDNVTQEKPKTNHLAFLAPLGVLLKTPTKPFQSIRSLLSHTPFGKLFLLVPVILLILIGIVYFYFFKMHAVVTLFVKADTVSVKQNATFSTTNGSDFSKDVIAATAQTTDIDGNVSASVTGSKEVGNKATGKVTIYNSSERTRTIASGTVITSSNNLAFTLDDDATVASASGDIYSGVKSGTTQVSVTAQNIGTDYNLPSGTTFTVGGDSSLGAKNDSAFSGGSKKNVTVVSQKDLDNLTVKLKSSLETKAMDVLSQKVQSGETLFPVFISETVSKTNFNKKVGDQASSVTLDGTVTYTGAAYQKDDLNQFATSVLKSQYSNIVLANGSTSETFADTKQSDTNIVTTVTINAGLLPKLNNDQIVSDISGKSVSDAKMILSNQPQVQSSDITLSPNIPLLPKLLPRQKENISLKISSQ